MTGHDRRFHPLAAHQLRCRRGGFIPDRAAL